MTQHIIQVNGARFTMALHTPQATGQQIIDAAHAAGCFTPHIRRDDLMLEGFYTRKKYHQGDMVYLVTEKKFLCLPDGPATAQ